MQLLHFIAEIKKLWRLQLLKYIVFHPYLSSSEKSITFLHNFVAILSSVDVATFFQHKYFVTHPRSPLPYGGVYA